MSVVAKSTVRVAGTRAMVIKGKVYDDNDAVVKANPSLFESPEAYAKAEARPTNTEQLGRKSMSARKRKTDDTVEEATATPGEKRTVRKP